MRPVKLLTRFGVALAVTAGVLVAAPEQAGAANVTATLVATRLTSTWGVPSPDPAGITWRPDISRLIISDSEVDEMPIYRSVNLYASRLDGTPDPAYNGTTLPYSKEPTGVGYKPNQGTLFVSDDDADEVYIFVPGPDRIHGTSDDTLTSFDTRTTGNTDAEGVDLDIDVTNDGHVYVVDGLNNDVFDYFWGNNRRFDGVPPAGDDTFRSFDVGAYGAVDPEGIEFFAGRSTLLVLEHKTKKIYEVTRQGALVNIIDVAAARAVNPAGLTLAPPSNGSAGPENLYLVDRGVDNDSDPTENDGKFYEMDLPDLAPVPGQNNPPSVSAGADQSVTLPASGSAQAALDGTVTDADGPAPLTTAWTQVNGPGTVTFGNAAAVDTTASFPTAGTYALQLAATDGASGSASDQVTITVTAGSPPPPPPPPPTGAVTVEKAIAAGSDDAEQVGAGAASLTSADVSLGQDGTRAQTVGLRFTGVTVPRGATITRAYIQFQVDEANTAPAALRFRGETADNAATYAATTGNITNRPTTTAAVTWTAPAWPTVGARGVDQQSADLSAILQEIINRGGWASGNALSVIVDGTGERTARSFEGKPPPLLHIEYTTS